MQVYFDMGHANVAFAVGAIVSTMRNGAALGVDRISLVRVRRSRWVGGLVGWLDWLVGWLVGVGAPCSKYSSRSVGVTHVVCDNQHAYCMPSNSSVYDGFWLLLLLLLLLLL